MEALNTTEQLISLVEEAESQLKSARNWVSSHLQIFSLTAYLWMPS